MSYLHGTRELCLSLQFQGDSSGVHHSYGGIEFSSTCRTLRAIGEEAYLEIFSDADWASNKQNRRSISATCIFFGTCLLHSASRMQKLISLSSGESEMYAASSAACDALLLKTLICFLYRKEPHLRSLSWFKCSPWHFIRAWVEFDTCRVGCCGCKIWWKKTTTKFQQLLVFTMFLT